MTIYNVTHIYFHVGNNLVHIEYNSTLQIINMKHSWQYVQCKLQFDRIYTLKLGSITNM